MYEAREGASTLSSWETVNRSIATSVSLMTLNAVQDPSSAGELGPTSLVKLNLFRQSCGDDGRLDALSLGGLESTRPRTFGCASRGHPMDEGRRSTGERNSRVRQPPDASRGSGRRSGPLTALSSNAAVRPARSARERWTSHRNLSQCINRSCPFLRRVLRDRPALSGVFE